MVFQDLLVVEKLTTLERKLLLLFLVSKREVFDQGPQLDCESAPFDVDQTYILRIYHFKVLVLDV